jgi:lysozyme
MDTSIQARELARQVIERHEGYTRFPKPDAHNTLEVGYGLNLNRRGLYRDEADWLVIQEVTRLYGWLSSFDWFLRMSPLRQAALLDMAYDLGEDGVDEFARMIAWLDQNDYASAADEMLHSKWADQVGQRAIDDAVLMRDDRSPFPIG